MWPANARVPVGLPSSGRGGDSGSPPLQQPRHSGDNETRSGRVPSGPAHRGGKMSEPNKYRDWILETIDSLRSRKARPDLERICRMVRRRHGSDPDRTRAELEKLIQEQTVLKVSYKGSISYRNAAKVQRKSRRKSEWTAADASAHSGADPAEPGPGQPCAPAPVWSPGERRGAASPCCEESSPRSAGLGPAPGATASDAPGRTPVRSGSSPLQQPPRKPEVPATEPAELGDLLVASVRSLSEEGSAKPLGLKEILGHLSSQERLSEEKLTRGRVRAVMEREVERGRLRRTRCGSVTVPPRGAEPAHSAPQDKRAGAKEIQDTKSPSEEEWRGDDEEEEEEEVGEENDDAPSCGEDGGPSPVAMTTEQELMVESTEDTETQREQEEILQQGEGLSELRRLPELKSPPAEASPQWIGSLSDKTTAGDSHSPLKHIDTQHNQLNHSLPSALNNLEYKTEVGASSCMLTPTASPRDGSLTEERGVSDCVEGPTRLAALRGSPVDWSVSDVVCYLTEAGFSEQAAAFRTQEIDGKSLLLMQRCDVLTGLSIKLGPALKIYERHVKVLQKLHFDDDVC